MSNNIYTPDRWVIIKLQTVDKEPHYRILAGWYGGFTTGDSWKLSSGIEKSLNHEKHYEFLNSSGSIYMCQKGGFGCSVYMLDIYKHYEAQCRDNGMLFEMVEESFVPFLERVS